MFVTTETRHLDRLGQLSEFEQNMYSKHRLLGSRKATQI